jgi:hypothetical protein
MAKKEDLLKALEKKFGNREFTHVKCLKLLPGFNHARKIYALLDALVKSGKLTRTEKGYKMSGKISSTEDFVKSFCKGKKLPITRSRLEIAVAHSVGPMITQKNVAKAMGVIRSALTDKRKVVTASLTVKCPRCQTAMSAVTFSNGRKAYYCDNDRVSLPR